MENPKNRVFRRAINDRPYILKRKQAFSTVWGTAMAVPQNGLSEQIILGELGKSWDFARDLLKIGCYRGTAIAVPYGCF